jgi:hypothetical protein
MAMFVAHQQNMQDTSFCSKSITTSRSCLCKETLKFAARQANMCNIKKIVKLLKFFKASAKPDQACQSLAITAFVHLGNPMDHIISLG